MSDKVLGSDENLASGWGAVRPSYKMVFGLSVITLSLVVPHALFSLVAFVFVGFVLQVFAKISWSKYLARYEVPAVFIIISLITILIEFGDIPLLGTVLWSAGDGRGIFITWAAVRHSAELGARVIGSLSGLFFISLSCSMVDILQQLRRLHVPIFFITIMEMIYRFSQSIGASFRRMIVSQHLRLGYFNLFRGVKSLGIAMGRLFSRVLLRSEKTSVALDLRLYQGSLQTLPKTYPVLRKEQRQIVVATIVVFLLGGGFTALYLMSP